MAGEMDWSAFVRPTQQRKKAELGYSEERIGLMGLQGVRLTLFGSNGILCRADFLPPDLFPLEHRFH